ncbi:phosphodiesterase, MJ0936 family [Gottschalkia acidurici 9a]|uniref:Phosphoesterase n=1 Tax=Gottschalkia acidurici (strain ATCC 7906 / DSM 604 / BCRC 14475 / CIP 104303 / KCTC 5404 / NCIMB 10678 / 9a) TaxID=1128398 RepID=K0AUB1_GOTA9|nr:metallophosphoesterase [Gottschalkia acidurici]AFS77408.1 phosphodiesterase, MJ0936 family [Gottschalkia acidurici 9a]
MKIGVISDTHGYIDGCLEKLKQIDNLNIIIHLGDYVKDAIKIENELGKKVIYVKGNCDFSENNVEEDKLIEIEGKKIFITHGHLYNVKSDMNRVFYRGKELDADMILFGHSHASMKIESENILILNPGSPTIPRGGSKKSIGIIEIVNGEIKSEIINID